MTYRYFIVAASVVLCSIADSAVAQERNSASYSTEVSIDYAFLRDVGENAKTGVVLDFGKQLRPNVSVVGEMALNHFSTLDETYSQFAGGVRYGTAATSRLRPFAQVLVGLQREFGSNGLNVQPGAGMNVRVARQIDAKFQVDVPFLRWEGESYRQFRFSAGLGLPLGR